MAGHLTLARLIQIAFVAGVFLVWHALSITDSVSHLFLPRLARVFAAVHEIAASGLVVTALSTTLSTVLVAYGIAVPLGILAGFAVTRTTLLMRVFEPLFASIFAIPLTLFFPLFILFFGIGPESKVAYGATYAFFPVVLNTISGLGYPNRKLVDAARSMGANSFQLFRRVLLPGALPVITGGLRIAFFICFSSVLGGETIASFTGLGHQVAHSAELMESARLFAWILFAILTAFSLTMFVSYLESLRRDIGAQSGR